MQPADWLAVNDQPAFIERRDGLQQVLVGALVLGQDLVPRPRRPRRRRLVIDGVEVEAEDKGRVAIVWGGGALHHRRHLGRVALP